MTQWYLKKIAQWMGEWINVWVFKLNEWFYELKVNESSLELMSESIFSSMNGRNHEFRTG